MNTSNQTVAAGDWTLSGDKQEKTYDTDYTDQP